MHSPLQFVPVNTEARPSHVVMSPMVEPYLGKLCQRLAGLELQDAQVGTNASHAVYPAQRVTRLAWIGYDPAFPEVASLFVRLMEYVQLANLHLGLDLWGFAEPLQYGVYETGGHYTWHMDHGPGGKPRPVRKLSFTLQLSDPAEYEGGELEILGDQRTAMPRDRGTLIVFPSYLSHRVKPVRSGTRRSLVGWVCGPDFR